MTRIPRPRQTLGAALLAALAVPASTAPSPLTPAPPAYRLVLRPDTLAHTGDLVRADDRCPQASATAEGAVVVGIDPATCAPAARPARITARVALRDVHQPTVVVLRLFAADHTPSPGSAAPAVMAVDGDTLLALRAGPGSALRPPARDVQPIVTTFVIRESREYVLSLSTAPGAAVEVRRVELAAHPLPASVRGIAYSPYRDCQVPGEGPQPSTAQVMADLRRIRHTAGAIRTYSARGANATAASAAPELGLAVWAGAWIDGPPGATSAADAAEIDSLLALAQAVPLAGLVVGNEYVLRRAGTEWDADRPRRRAAAAAYLAARMAEVRSRLGDRRIPVGTAEIAGDVFGPGPEVHPEYRPVLEQADFLLVHLHPFWEGEDADGAAARTVETYAALARALAQAYPGAPRRLVLGETGWPSAGAATAAGGARRAQGTQLNSTRYARDFLAAAEAGGTDFFYFAFADEAWKAAVEGEGQGESWGMLNADRTAKLPVQSVLVPREELPDAAAVPAEPWPAPVEPCEGVGVCVYDEWRRTSSPVPADRGTASLNAAPPPDAAGPRFVPSGFMGDADRVALDECAAEDRVHGRMSARGSVRLDGAQGWGGAAWLAAGGWNGGGTDLRAGGGGRTVLRFWARGIQGGEQVSFGATDRRGTRAETGWVRLDREWRRLEVDVGRLDRSAVVAGFWWVADRAHNPGREAVEVLMDNVRYEVTP
jgi:exo-beta-1,3-glucanase (GH17 family)